MLDWLRNVWLAVSTVAHGLWVTLRYWLITYREDRGTFTEKFEYPEKPVPVAARYRGFHRYDLTTCIACDQCAGGVKEHMAQTLVDAIGSDNIMFEAPEKSQQTYLILHFGTDVNLGNIRTDDVIPLETLRCGIRGDTFGKV